MYTNRFRSWTEMRSALAMVFEGLAHVLRRREPQTLHLARLDVIPNRRSLPEAKRESTTTEKFERARAQGARRFSIDLMYAQRDQLGAAVDGGTSARGHFSSFSGSSRPQPKPPVRTGARALPANNPKSLPGVRYPSHGALPQC
jgi:hypothetical protein